jgi:hypothetical protein
MKFDALILLFPFTIFLIETSSFPLEVKTICSETQCMRQANMELNCNGEKDQDQKSPGKCNTPDCSVCPVCFLFIFQPQYEWSINYFSFKTNYNSVNSRYVSSYIASIWKPPNHDSIYKETT